MKRFSTASDRWEIKKSVHCAGYKNCHEDLRTFELDDPNCKDCLKDTEEAFQQLEEAHAQLHRSGLHQN